ncbi:MAG: glyoxalase/bleomycin resistance/dioxygenase family protein [Pantoea eucrina]|nr:glyoxalase/bleomycin resistance/dioxygenase family protein [Pantoea eucrina]
MIKRADHVGFSVRNIEESLFFWTQILGGELLCEGKMSGPIIDEVTGARGADVRMALLELAGIKIELLQYDNISRTLIRFSAKYRRMAGRHPVNRRQSYQAPCREPE